jgi:hypothetical protein
MLRPRALDLFANFGDIANRQLASRSPVRFKEAVHLIGAHSSEGRSD